jgi:serine/threonine protein kinase
MDGQDPLLDQILGDDFRVLRLLGFGGFARVYLAEQLSVGRRKVALKVLHAAHGDMASAVGGLKREAAFLARELTRIRCDVMLPVSRHQLQRRAPDLAAIEDFCGGNGFGSLLRNQAARLAQAVAAIG